MLWCARGLSILKKQLCTSLLNLTLFVESYMEGILSSSLQDPSKSAISSQLSVGKAGIYNKTIKVLGNFILEAPGPSYTCGAAKIEAKAYDMYKYIVYSYLLALILI